MAGKLSPSRSIAWSTYASIPQRSTSILLTRPSAPHNHDRQRCLHTTPHRRGGQRASWPYMEPPETGINAPQIRKGIEQFESKTKSQAVYAGEMMAEGEMPSDIGLLFGTLILDKTNKPSFSPFDSTSWAYQMNKLVKRVRELGSLIAMKYYLGWRKTKLDFRSRGKEAQRLHKLLYSAFAGNDTGIVKDIALEGTRDALQARMLSRPRNIKYEWQLLKYNSSPKIMSDRALMARISEEQAEQYPFIRQTVVKIDSTQSLLRISPDNEEPERIVDAQRVAEYFVLQQNLDETKPGVWKIWGSTEATDPREVMEAAADTTGQAQYRAMEEDKAT